MKKGMSLGKMLAIKLGLQPETRPGKIEWPMNEKAIAEQARHSAVLDPLVEQGHLLQTRLKAVEAAIEAEQAEWRANMVAAHPEMKDYSFSIDEEKMVMRVDYREGEKLLPGDSYADVEESDLPKPPEWVEGLKKTLQ